MAEEWVGYDGGAVQNWHRSASRIRVAPNVAVIPEEAFMECDTFRAVDLGNVTTISKMAFWGCSSLERVIWSTASAVEIENGAFAGCVGLEEIDLRNVTKIGQRSFAHCNALTRVAIPSSVAAIEWEAFQDCKNLAAVELCEGIHRIAKGAFYNCSSLARITIPASVTDIKDRAFYGCSSLVHAELSEGLQRIGTNAFEGCTSLAGICIPSTTLKVEGGAFNGCSQLRHAEFQEGLQEIGDSAFYGCQSIERVTIPASVTYVGSHAFQNCTSLAEVTLREGVQEIGATFINCTSLEHINIPPVALVIDVTRRSCQLMRTTMPNPRSTTLVASKWLQYRSQGQLEQAEAKVNEILQRQDPRRLAGEPAHGFVGRLWQARGEKSQYIRRWFAYYYLLDVTTMLELGLSRVNMDGKEQDLASFVIPGVLPYLGN